MSVLRRARGAILRLTRRRGLSLLLGIAAAGPAAYLNMIDIDPPWWITGLATVLAATGVALIWTGLFGIGQDWVE
jgi:hypothetical protein